jgi:hypothetical protein
MRSQSTLIRLLALLIAGMWASHLPAQPPKAISDSRGPADDKSPARAAADPVASHAVPFDALPIEVRDKVRQVIQTPTFSARGPGEAFSGRPELYDWLLDHPDRALVAWKRLGAVAAEISCLGEGRFSWHDEQCGEVHWSTVLDRNNVRIWYAQGSVRPAPFMPHVPVQAVLVLHHGAMPQGQNHSLLLHRTEIYVLTDSKAAAFAAKLMGGSVARLSEQGLGQLELFFSGLVWYLDQHPERMARLLQAEKVAR